MGDNDLWMNLNASVIKNRFSQNVPTHLNILWDLFIYGLSSSIYRIKEHNNQAQNNIYGPIWYVGTIYKP